MDLFPGVQMEELEVTGVLQGEPLSWSISLWSQRAEVLVLCSGGGWEIKAKPYSEP